MLITNVINTFSYSWLKPHTYMTCSGTSRIRKTYISKVNVDIYLLNLQTHIQ